MVCKFKSVHCGHNRKGIVCTGFNSDGHQKSKAFINFQARDLKFVSALEPKKNEALESGML